MVANNDVQESSTATIDAKAQGLESVSSENLDVVERNKREKALGLAHDIRKFEIELYWKRATYFWALIATAIGGFIALLNSEPSATNLLARSLKSTLLEFIASMAFLFSVGWFFVNKASKFWQRNWEYHVDELEDDFSGPLYKRVHYRESDSWWRPHYTYAFSPTAVNQLLSCFVALLTFFLCLLPLPWGSSFNAMKCDFFLLLPIIVFSLTLFATFALWYWARNLWVYGGESTERKIRIRVQRRTTEVAS